jgi:hypothetical protein
MALAVVTAWCDPWYVADEQLRWVREQLDELTFSRLSRPFDPVLQARYKLLCRQERELLQGLESEEASVIAN